MLFLLLLLLLLLFGCGTGVEFSHQNLVEDLRASKQESHEQPLDLLQARRETPESADQYLKLPIQHSFACSKLLCDRMVAMPCSNAAAPYLAFKDVRLVYVVMLLK
jgi:hypothetical protein